jgi:hypothetical protein
MYSNHTVHTASYGGYYGSAASELWLPSATFLNGAKRQSERLGHVADFLHLHTRSDITVGAYLLHVR